MNGNLVRHFKTESQNNNHLNNLIDNILTESEGFLSGSEQIKLYKSLSETLKHFEIGEGDNRDIYKNFEEINDELFQKYLRAMIIEGKSKKTLTLYETSFKKFIDFCQKPLSEIVSEDVRTYLIFKKENFNVCNKTLDNIRRNLSAVFAWFDEEGYIKKNPLIGIRRIKNEKKIKKPFSLEDIELLRREFAKNPKHSFRDLAIFELLLSSGIRVGELVRLNRSDIDLNECSMIVLGKGNKQREAYFNVKTQIAIKLYLQRRTDDNPALFVSFRRPYFRIGISAVEQRIRDAGRNAGISKSYPHRFRRTFATTLLNKGVNAPWIVSVLLL